MAAIFLTILVALGPTLVPWNENPAAEARISSHVPGNECPAPASRSSSSETYDLVVYGGTSSGIIAAVQAARSGSSVIVVCPDRHLGGLSSGGLGWTDTGNKAVIGGLSREFYQRIRKHYDSPEAWIHGKPEDYPRFRPDSDAHWTFEPHVAEQVFEQMVVEAKIPVKRGRWLDREKGVRKEGRTIVSITMLNGETYRGRMFIDATYEGDLMAAAGVSYTVGREPNSLYGETLNGVQVENARSHQFENPVDPYIVPGDPSSGLLPRIHAGPPGTQGEGDRRVQAYCFRMCLTDVPENRVPFEKPEGYDATQYELLARYLDTGWDAAFRKFDRIPNRKTDTNNHGAFSTDNIGMNYDYPDASYERRAAILKEHELYQKGFCYFLANDPRVPEPIRSKMNRWGLAKDEFEDNGHWPHQIYIREARRMVSAFVVTENHLRRRRPSPRPVGMGSYNMDSHNVQRYVDARGLARNEGDVQINPGSPYPIDYGAIVPRRAECENLLVPVCVSSSHIAYGSIRMEPVFMILGQSAALAAILALDKGVPVQDVDYAELKQRLLAAGVILDWPGREPSRPSVDPKKLPGLVQDDSQAVKQGNWCESTSVEGYVGDRYLHDGNIDKGKSTVRFACVIEKTGRYDVRLAYRAHANRAARVPVLIRHADGKTLIHVNQRTPPPIERTFLPLGTFRFIAGTEGMVTVSNEGTDGFVVADAVQFIEKEP